MQCDLAGRPEMEIMQIFIRWTTINQAFSSTRLYLPILHYELTVPAAETPPPWPCVELSSPV